MKKIIFALAFLLSAQASAKDGAAKLNVAIGVQLSDAILDGGQDFTLNTMDGYTYAAVFVDYQSDGGAATAVTMGCSARYSASDATNYQLHACDAVSSPTLACGPKLWSNAVSASEAWVWHVPMIGQNLHCDLAGTGANSGDTVTVSVRQGVE